MWSQMMMMSKQCTDTHNLNNQMRTTSSVHRSHNLWLQSMQYIVAIGILSESSLLSSEHTTHSILSSPSLEAFWHHSARSMFCSFASVHSAGLVVLPTTVVPACCISWQLREWTLPAGHVSWEVRTHICQAVSRQTTANWVSVLLCFCAKDSAEGTCCYFCTMLDWGLVKAIEDEAVWQDSVTKFWLLILVPVSGISCLVQSYKCDPNVGHFPYMNNS